MVNDKKAPAVRQTLQLIERHVFKKQLNIIIYEVNVAQN